MLVAKFMSMRGSLSFDGLDDVVVLTLQVLQAKLMEMNSSAVLVSRHTQTDLLNVHPLSASIWTFKRICPNSS